MINSFIQKHGQTFLKYALVGVSGTLIDVATFTLLATHTVLGADWTGRVIAASIGFLLAVINNYIWNRRWTFRSRARKVHYELLTFFVVSCGGYLLNILFLTFFIWILFALLGLEQTSTLPAWANAGAKVSASAVVLTYNFVANRFWTFRDSISS